MTLDRTCSLFVGWPPRRYDFRITSGRSPSFLKSPTSGKDYRNWMFIVSRSSPCDLI